MSRRSASRSWRSISLWRATCASSSRSSRSTASWSASATSPPTSVSARSRWHRSTRCRSPAPSPSWRSAPARYWRRRWTRWCGRTRPRRVACWPPTTRSTRCTGISSRSSRRSSAQTRSTSTPSCSCSASRGTSSAWRTTPPTSPRTCSTWSRARSTGTRCRTLRPSWSAGTTGRWERRRSLTRPSRRRGLPASRRLSEGASSDPGLPLPGPGRFAYAPGRGRNLRGTGSAAERGSPPGRGYLLDGDGDGGRVRLARGEVVHGGLLGADVLAVLGVRRLVAAAEVLAGACRGDAAAVPLSVVGEHELHRRAGGQHGVDAAREGQAAAGADAGVVAWRRADRHAREDGPGAVEAELHAQFVAVHELHAVAADERGLDDARRGTALDRVHGAQRTLGAEGAVELRRGSPQRTPVVQRAVIVVGIVHAPEVRDGRGAGPAVLDVLRVAAGAREVDGQDGLAIVDGHDAGGGLHGGVGARVFDADADVGLAAHVAVHVPGLARLARAEGEGARRAGLRLERFEGPRGGHFMRHDAAQVALQRHGVDHHQRAAAAHHADHAAIRARVAEVRRREDAQRPRAGREGDRGAEVLAHAAGDHAVRD